MADWNSASGELAHHVLAESDRTVNAYAVQPTLVREHVGIEANIFASGYGQRQVFELVQNAADAIFVGRTPGRVRIVLTNDALYCANEGAPIDRDGVTAILMAYLSAKKGEQIGHFGLGFKSVLSVTSTPQFFCRAGSFGFDKALSFRRIATVLPDVEDVPVLRVGHLLDPLQEAAKDQALADLMQWATTVVRLPRNVGESLWLSSELANFPSEFLVFSPHVQRLELHDTLTGQERVIQVSADGPFVTIADGGVLSRWRAFHRRLQTSELTPDQLDDAEAATRTRESLPLIWALPLETDRSRGRFWAFFPTETETTLTGILNAPWKTNADRQNLLDGPFNRRLLEECVRIAVEEWPGLVQGEDPGSLLDLLPARDQDAKNWADRAIGEGLFRELALVPSLPGAAGDLVRPSEVLLRPDLVTSDGGRQWLSDFPSADTGGTRAWVHRSVESRDRRARAERLQCQRGSLRQWLEDVAAERTPEASLCALALVDALLPRLTYNLMPEVKSARMVLTTALTLEAPRSPLCLAVEGVSAPSGIVLAHPELMADRVGLETLRKLGVQPISIEVQLEYEMGSPSPGWERAWQLIRKLSAASAQTIVRTNARRLQVRTVAGSFEPAHQTLLAGPVADPRNQEDHRLIVDMEFHETDLALLKAAGVVDRPTAGLGTLDGAWYDAYLKAARVAYRTVESRGYAQDIIPEPSPIPGPLYGLVHGSVELKARFTKYLLPLVPSEMHWTFYCKTRPKAYARVSITEPVRWCLKSLGFIDTSLGPTKLSSAVSPALSDWSVLLPVASAPKEVLEQLDVPATLTELTEIQWQDALGKSREITSRADLEVCWAFYAAACSGRQTPIQISVLASDQVTTESPGATLVTDDRERFEALQEAGAAAILVPGRTAVEELVNKWGLFEAAATVTPEASGESEPLLDVLPGLAPYVSAVVAESTWLQPCSKLWLEIRAHGEVRHREVFFARMGSVLHYLDGIQRGDLLDRVGRELGLSLSADQRSAALARLQDEQQRKASERVSAAQSVAAKLLAAIGEEAVRRQLPSRVVDAALSCTTGGAVGLVLADAALAVFGVELLKRYRHELAAAGLGPPSQWTGGRSALEFCERLGFPLEYAGFEIGRRDPMFEVDGPIELKPLHDFQKPIADRIRKFFLQVAPDRGLLSLPTGAGKTRVVVEALIGAFRETHEKQLVIWIAQSDELCEQAVQAWGQAWRALGPAMRLRVSRLWGSTNNRVRHTDGAHVVVATYQSLKSRLTWRDYEWLKKARCLVIDEAHGSTAPSYTEILESLGITARETDRHLIGLTATPFRGSGGDDAETRWLANRYGKNRFDHDVIPGDDPYPYLQRLGVLAQVNQEVIEGKNITLTELEVQHLNRYNELPPDAERRLGEDDVRNRSLVDAIAALDADWPVLLFATSVDHAFLMAALLSMRGISAKAISGNTDAGARRHYVGQFKARKIRVLTNYGVLTTGFDAPSVRALIIARPVYSRGLYQQMIGRGLRGPLNGGKERCLIINVADNVAQYGGQLAFRGFEHLWRPWGTGAHPV